MRTTPSLFTIFLLLGQSLNAGSTASANYDIPAATIDSGGGKSSSVTYTNDGSAGGLVGFSTFAAPVLVAKHGYIGQLYEITGLQLAATPVVVQEGQTTQLAPFAVADDESLLALGAGEIVWSVTSGPLLSINAGGLATAGIVFEDTAATAGGSFGNLSDTLDLTVLNSLQDNFGLYAADGLPDDWQVRFFGVSNPLAAPGVDFTGNGQTNLFSYIADLDPTDHEAVFRLRIERDLAGNRMKLIFSPRKESRNYQVLENPGLENPGLEAPGWKPLVATPIAADNGTERTVTDTATLSNRKFYRVEITVPE